jgi:hypothetical protein
MYKIRKVRESYKLNEYLKLKDHVYKIREK